MITIASTTPLGQAKLEHLFQLNAHKKTFGNTGPNCGDKKSMKLLGVFNRDVFTTSALPAYR